MKWEQVNFRRIELRDSAVEAMLTALRNTHIMQDNDNGVLLACFEPHVTGEFDEAANANHPLDENSLIALLRSPSIRESLRESNLEFAADVEIADLRVVRWAEVEERLADQLRHGGFVGGLNWSIEKARSMSNGLLRAVIDRRRSRTTLAITYAAWAPWFYDMLCDMTILLCDVSSRRFIVLAVTDSD